MNGAKVVIALTLLGCLAGVLPSKKAEYKINPFFGYHKYKIVKYQPAFVAPPPIYAMPPPQPMYDYSAPPPAYAPSYAPAVPSSYDQISQTYDQAPAATYDRPAVPIGADFAAAPGGFDLSAAAVPNFMSLGKPSASHDVTVDAYPTGSY